MQLGAMNNPMIDVIEEISIFADLGFGFIDLTLEPEETYASTLDVKKVAKALKKANLGAVGHTAWYIPIASPFPEFRKLALTELEKCLNVTSELGIAKMNLHPHVKAPLHNEEWVIAHNIEALATLDVIAKSKGVQLLIENMPAFSRVAQLKPILDAVPDVELLLDVGHANLDTPYNRSEEILSNFGHRLGHVHVSDNRGGHDDQHLPLGVGNINWLSIVRELKNVNYDGTITIEVFGDDDDYLVMSRKKLQYLWDNTEPGEKILGHAQIS